mmetsp:Transcript_61750/g.139784  ORF Transcript_61750/g.139784 Transcript_61750/m.139784 type:complete len:118 (+) Transcript_61750:3-356(+)
MGGADVPRYGSPGSTASTRGYCFEALWPDLMGKAAARTARDPPTSGSPGASSYSISAPALAAPSGSPPGVTRSPPPALLLSLPPFEVVEDLPRASFAERCAEAGDAPHVPPACLAAQ